MVLTNDNKDIRNTKNFQATNATNSGTLTYNGTSWSSAAIPSITTNAEHIQNRVKNHNIDGIEYIKGLGWTKGLPDLRDLIYEPGRLSLPGKDKEKDRHGFITSKFPSRVDLRDVYDRKYPILDQGDLGSCTSFAIGSLLTYNNIKQDLEDNTTSNDSYDPFIPSHLFIYYNERVAINTINSDSGAVIRDGIKSVVRQGVCTEKQWPYDINKFTIKPSNDAYLQAMNHQAILYFKIVNSNVQNLKACLVEGFPFVFGFSVYTSFMSNEVARTGKVPYPNARREQLLGGHAVTCVGYDDFSQTFICRNHWGADWGDHGYFYMPYQYLTNTNLSDDFWVIKKVEVNDEDQTRSQIVTDVLTRQLQEREQGFRNNDDI